MLTTAPYWGPYAPLAAENGSRVATAPCPVGASPWIGGLGGRAEALMEDQGRVLLWLNDPCHNPTGRSLCRADGRCCWRCCARSAEPVP